MAKTQKQISRPEPSSLQVSRKDAEEKIDARIAKGEELRGEQIQNAPGLEDARQRYYQWDDYNRTLLDTLFTGRTFQNEYSSPLHIVFGGSGGLHYDINEHKDDIRRKMGRLQSIRDRVELLKEPVQVMPSHSSTLETNFSSPNPLRDRLSDVRGDKDKVFVVFGHNEMARLKLENFLHRSGIDPIVINQQPKAGRTIIEQIEHHSNVRFAVVLLTDDDLGAAKEDVKTVSDLKPRARQNALVELGYFMGRIGRDKTVALVSPGIEKPSDYDGVLYISLESDWENELKRELRAAELQVNE